MTQPTVRIRCACLEDLDDIDRIEQASFSGDRLSRRSLRYLLTRARAVNRVAELDGRIVGYVTVLTRSGSTSARVYSLAVDPGARGARIGARLIEAAEQSVRSQGLDSMRLEVRADNGAAIHLYEAAGYNRFASEPGYYEDGETALKLRKTLRADR